eukprot:COSAG01_NODE_586_length_15170_cov_32.511512_7_plen_109_part_00
MCACALERRPGQLPLRLQRSSSGFKYSCYMERTCEVADGLLRDVSKRSSGRSLVCGDDRQQKAKLRLQCDAAEYRWWQVENAVGGFDAPPRRCRSWQHPPPPESCHVE